MASQLWRKESRGRSGEGKEIEGRREAEIDEWMMAGGRCV